MRGTGEDVAKGDWVVVFPDDPENRFEGRVTGVTADEFVVNAVPSAAAKGPEATFWRTGAIRLLGFRNGVRG